MLNALGMNAATEHQVSQARFTLIDNTEADNTIAAESVLTGHNISIQIGGIDHISKNSAVISSSGKVHLVRPLREFVDPLQVFFRERRHGQPDITMPEKCLVVFLEIYFELLPFLLDFVHHAAVPAFFRDRNLDFLRIQDRQVLPGIQRLHPRRRGLNLLAFKWLIIDKEQRVDTDVQAPGDCLDCLTLRVPGDLRIQEKLGNPKFFETAIKTSLRRTTASKRGGQGQCPSCTTPRQPARSHPGSVAGTASVVVMDATRSVLPIATSSAVSPPLGPG